MYDFIILFESLMDGLQFRFSVLGFTFSFWEVIVFTVVASCAFKIVGVFFDVD